jgi:hypothetical protein
MSGVAAFPSDGGDDATGLRALATGARPHTCSGSSRKTSSSRMRDMPPPAVLGTEMDDSSRRYACSALRRSSMTSSDILKMVLSGKGMHDTMDEYCATSVVCSVWNSEYRRRTVHRRRGSCTSTM